MKAGMLAGVLLSLSLSATFVPGTAASPVGCGMGIGLMCVQLSAGFAGRVCQGNLCTFYIDYFVSCYTSVAGGGECKLFPTHSSTKTCTWDSGEGCFISHSDTFQSSVSSHCITATATGRHNLGFADAAEDSSCI